MVFQKTAPLLQHAPTQHLPRTVFSQFFKSSRPRVKPTSTHRWRRRSDKPHPFDEVCPTTLLTRPLPRNTFPRRNQHRSRCRQNKAVGPQPALALRILTRKTRVREPSIHTLHREHGIQKHRAICQQIRQRPRPAIFLHLLHHHSSRRFSGRRARTQTPAQIRPLSTRTATRHILHAACTARRTPLGPRRRCSAVVLGILQTALRQRSR